MPSGRAGNTGSIKTLGDTYQFTVDVSDFSPEDIVITTSKNQIEVHAEKVIRPLDSLRLAAVWKVAAEGPLIPQPWVLESQLPACEMGSLGKWALPACLPPFSTAGVKEKRRAKLPSFLHSKTLWRAETERAAGGGQFASASGLGAGHGEHGGLGSP